MELGDPELCGDALRGAPIVAADQDRADIEVGEPAAADLAPCLSAAARIALPLDNPRREPLASRLSEPN